MSWPNIELFLLFPLLNTWLQGGAMAQCHRFKSGHVDLSQDVDKCPWQTAAEETWKVKFKLYVGGSSMLSQISLALCINQARNQHALLLEVSSIRFSVRQRVENNYLQLKKLRDKSRSRQSSGDLALATSRWVWMRYKPGPSLLGCVGEQNLVEQSWRDQGSMPPAWAESQQWFRGTVRSDELKNPQVIHCGEAQQRVWVSCWWEEVCSPQNSCVRADLMYYFRYPIPFCFGSGPYFSPCGVSERRSSVIHFDPFLASKPACTLWGSGTGLLIIPTAGSGEQVEGAVLIVPWGSDVLFLISRPQQQCFWSRLQASNAHLNS